MRTEIPARVEIHCDACGQQLPDDYINSHAVKIELDESEQSSRRKLNTPKRVEATFQIDFFLSRARGKVKSDLCTSCLKRFLTSMVERL